MESKNKAELDGTLHPLIAAPYNDTMLNGTPYSHDTASYMLAAKLDGAFANTNCSSHLIGAASHEGMPHWNNTSHHAVFNFGIDSDSSSDDDIDGLEVDNRKPAAIVSSSQNILRQNTDEPNPRRVSTSPIKDPIDEVLERKVSIKMSKSIN